MHPVTTKTSTWSLSVGIHALWLLGFAFFWVVRAEEETLGCPRFQARHEQDNAPQFPDREAELHPPFEPKVFQPDPVIVNVAREVVVNTIPDEIDSLRASGQDIDFVTAEPFKGKAVSAVVGASGGGGRFGAYAGRFG